MKKLIFTLIIILCFFVYTFAQVKSLPCPEINVTAPEGLIKIGNNMTFSAFVGETIEQHDYMNGLSIREK